MEYWFAEQEARLRNLPSTKRYLYEKMDIILFSWKEGIPIP